MLSFLIFSSVANAEDLVPAGTKVETPEGKVKILPSPGTIIDMQEKGIIVREFDLCEIDRKANSALRSTIEELGKKSTLDEREIQILKDRSEMEKTRAEFYEEQMRVRDQTNKQALEKMESIIKESKPSALEKLISKGGWVGLLVTIGIVIGIAL